MSDEDINENQESPEELKKRRAEAKNIRVTSLTAIRGMKTDSSWNLLEELLQDVMSVYVIQNPDKQHQSMKKLKSDATGEINVRYAKDETLRDLLLNALPSEITLAKWVKKEKWIEAVWEKVRTDGLFTAESRSTMIKALYDRGLEKSDSAAKIWLTLSGDYSDKLDVSTDKTLDKYREINEILHKKKDN